MYKFARLFTTVWIQTKNPAFFSAGFLFASQLKLFLEPREIFSEFSKNASALFLFRLHFS
jgi:hypothetical protein